MVWGEEEGEGEEGEGGEGEEEREEKEEEQRDEEDVWIGWVLTEASEQWSISPLLKRVMSLMKTAVALRMKDMKRCMWM